MRLNEDCVRSILLTTEDKTGYNKQLIYPMQKEICELLASYSEDEIMYHIEQCKKSGLIEARNIDISGNICINDLTPTGHSFLANIRQENVWNKTKDVAKEVGSKSLEAIIQIASNVISEVIKNKF